MLVSMWITVSRESCFARVLTFVSSYGPKGLFGVLPRGENGLRLILPKEQSPALHSLTLVGFRFWDGVRNGSKVFTGDQEGTLVIWLMREISETDLV